MRNTPIIPNVPEAKPLFELIFSKLFPSSVLFQSAEPSPPLFRLKGVRFILHVAAYKILGFSGNY